MFLQHTTRKKLGLYTSRWMSSGHPKLNRDSCLVLQWLLPMALFKPLWKSNLLIRSQELETTAWSTTLIMVTRVRARPKQEQEQEQEQFKIISSMKRTRELTSSNRSGTDRVCIRFVLTMSDVLADSITSDHRSSGGTTISLSMLL